ncbi:hypothetical protein L6164_021172 [Bauhinia variegata]|uniref:Uncharacterized protein n=1 Tax=Bauhinia variegata TaxID=167791 RepID=A0ACB9MZF0_BAUVA|nr:hypothetical protein L6164_021172 [Bauhinia variegata]
MSHVVLYGFLVTLFFSALHSCSLLLVLGELEQYMDYDIDEICKDDWKLAQKLVVHGCDPLPRRRCFTRAPKLYRKTPRDTADFSYMRCLILSGEMELGLAFGVGILTFAARTMEFNVTIFSAIINLVTYFNEMVALTALIPLTINQRSPQPINKLNS